MVWNLFSLPLLFSVIYFRKNVVYRKWCKYNKTEGKLPKNTVKEDLNLIGVVERGSRFAKIETEESRGANR